MLKSTFQHLKGISKKREQEIWAKGILTWDIYKQKINEQLINTDKNKVCHILTETEHAYKNKDISFFRENLSSTEYYRIALEYPDDVIF